MSPHFGESPVQWSSLGSQSDSSAHRDARHGQGVIGKMPPRIIKDLNELETLVGQEVSTSDWVEITQDRINRFAEATGDFQWIHLDAERCAKESPFKVPIAHGYLTMSLIPMLADSAHQFEQEFQLVVNYGMEKLRFPAPVPVGSRVRLRESLLSLTNLRGNYKAVWEATIELDGGEKPACVAQTVVLYYPNGA